MKITPYERVKLWRKQNPDKFKEQWIRNYQNNAEKIKAKKREKYRKDRELFYKELLSK